MSLPALLLVNPRACSTRSARLPLSLLALAAALEGKAESRILDGNVEPDLREKLLAALDATPHALLAVTVMPGPQVAPAIAISRAVKERHPSLPVVWGGYFPTLYASAAINAPYVDVVVRGPGEETLADLARILPGAGAPTALSSASDTSALRSIPGITFKEAGAAVHNVDRPFRPPDHFPPAPLEKLGDLARWLQPTVLGRRTAVHQAAIGCRYRCSFCGVVSMFDGKTHLSGPARVAAAVRRLATDHGADAVQFYDNNFFDREETTIPLLEALATARLPYWCYARPDALAGFSTRSWELARRSGLSMAFLGAEASSDEVLRSMHKGARVESTLEAARRCREYGVVPEFSFVLGGPSDPEGEVERTFEFIRRLKALHPACEVILYFWTPTPRRSPEALRRGTPLSIAPVATKDGESPLDLPESPEEWTEPRWVDFVCHRNAPWITPAIRRRVDDFATVLSCRFPTVQDVRLPRWGKAILSGAASWRWGARSYSRPFELEALRRLLPLRRPEAEGL